MIFKCEQPTLLQSLASNKAECIRHALSQLDCPHDAALDSTFYRVLSAFGCDGFSGNLRTERSLARDIPGRISVGLLCDAHKRATVSGLGFSLLKPFDSHVIRLALSLQGQARAAIRREIRQLIREQLVVIRSGSCTAEADRYRDMVYDMVLPTDSAHNRYRKAIVSGLFNGDIRVRGRIEHVERGCCRSLRQTCSAMCNEGLQAIWPSCVILLNRQSWTGAGAAAAAAAAAMSAAETNIMPHMCSSTTSYSKCAC